MNQEPTEVFLPASFPYPIKVVSVDAAYPGDVARGTRLLSYSFVHLAPQKDALPETRFGTWDSALDGTIERWNIKPGDVVSHRKARERPAMVLIEPCKHGMQLGGLCVLCGKDMTISDYIGFSDASRASIQMNHSAQGPTVSFQVAQEMGRHDAIRLQNAKKLSLIVDLDQTVVHATVDPTVGEWISEGEDWEQKHSSKPSSSKSPPHNPTDEDDECNPNWEALRDVKKFMLGPDVVMGKGKGKAPENGGTMYYIKPRPGWEAFFREVGKKYEMHVYTMGTRAYAEQVCRAIDPEGRIFGGRILTRDESGSLTQKSLRRLFPVDTSMVVIIDDRADVWEWSPNLIKVIPYDFFIGIGDINGTFLPKQESIVASTPPPREKPPEEPSPDNPGTNDDDVESDTAMSEQKERAELQTNALLTRNSQEIEAQVEERPLAKKQEELQESDEDTGVDENKKPEVSPSSKGDAGVSDDSSKDGKQHQHHQRKALLKNDDRELLRVREMLDEVHKQYYVAYDAHAALTSEKPKSKSKPRSKSAPQHDVTRIIPEMRSRILAGVHILFSSVIPLDTNPETTEIWRMAHMFGAQCYTELNNTITHVVAAKSGTVKVDSARRRGGTKIVWLAWFTDSIALWQRQDEAHYYLDGAAASQSTRPENAPPSKVPDELIPDGAEDWDDGSLEGGANGVSSGLELDTIDWNDINDEVDAAMNESDDNDDDSDARSDHSGRSDDWTDETNSVISNTNGSAKRKRPRSRTPSDVGSNMDSSDEALRSPLAKRKKIAAERSGASRLKDSMSAGDFAGRRSTTPSSHRGSGDSRSMEDSDEDEDFLADAMNAGD